MSAPERPAREVVPLSVPAAGGLITSRECRLYGYSFKETSGAAVAALTVTNGTDASGQATVFVNLAVSESVRDWFGPHGIYMRTGVSVTAITGAILGTVWVELL